MISNTLNELPIKKLFKKMEAAIENVSDVMGDPALKEIIASAKGAMEKANGLIENTDQLVTNVDRQVAPVADSITHTAADAQALLRNVNGHVDPVAAKVAASLDKANAALLEAEKTMQGIQDLTAEGSVTHYRMNRALDEITRMARSLRVLTDYMEQYPDSVLRGKGNAGGE
jgi:paraquat-inducible protein B